MSFMRASCMGPSSVIEWTVVYMEGRRWMFGVERVKQTSLVGTVPTLIEEEGREEWTDKLHSKSQ